MTTSLGRPRPHPRPQNGLATRQLIALVTGLHPDTVRRKFEPKACDVRSRANLYSIDEVNARLAR